MIFDRKYIATISLFGIILLFSYYFLLKDNNNALKLWGKIKGNLLNVYYLSMLLATIGFLLFYYYLFCSTNFSKDNTFNIFITALLVVIISIFWTPYALAYYKTKKDMYKYLTLFVLFLVALFTFLLLLSIYNVNDQKYELNKNLALIGILYFFIHVFFFDFILWSYNFF